MKPYYLPKEQISNVSCIIGFMTWNEVCCNIPQFRDKNDPLMSTKNREIFFSSPYIYIYIHGFHIKIYRNFDAVPPIPEGPKLSTCNLFTLLITHIS